MFKQTKRLSVENNMKRSDENRSRAISRLLFATLIIVSLIIAIAAVLKLRSFDASASPKSAMPASKPAAFQPVPNPMPGDGHGPTNVVRFTLYDVGILPRETRVQSGNVTLAIVDVSGMNSVIVLEKETGDAGSPLVVSGQIERVQRVSRVEKEFALTPGRYWVSTVDKPETKVLLIVEE